MKVLEIAKLLNAEVLTGQEMAEKDAVSACGCDMMSDVLSFVHNVDGILLTGLTNPQVIRTVAMMDMCCVIFVRGKQPDEKTISLAKQNNIIVLCTKFSMFTACGLLYRNGINGEGLQSE